MTQLYDITRETCRLFLAAFMDENDLKARKVAEAITCSEITLNRILAGKTLASDEMMKQTGIMIELGFKLYSQLSQAQKEEISETIGAVGGGVLGFGSISAVISTLGYAGLSAAGIASGLSALGTTVGGGMLAGVSVAAVIPIAATAAGYGVIKGIKAIIEKQKLDDKRYDLLWELPLDAMDSGEDREKFIEKENIKKDDEKQE